MNLPPELVASLQALEPKTLATLWQWVMDLQPDWSEAKRDALKAIYYEGAHAAVWAFRLGEPGLVPLYLAEFLAKLRSLSEGNLTRTIEAFMMGAEAVQTIGVGHLDAIVAELREFDQGEYRVMRQKYLKDGE